MAQWRRPWPGVLVVLRTGTLAGGTGQRVSKSVNGFKHGHVGVFKHGLDALERLSSVSKTSAVDHCANVGPLGIHGTGGVDDERQFHLATAGVVPCDLNVVVGVDHHVRVAFVTDDRREQTVVEEGHGSA